MNDGYITIKDIYGHFINISNACVKKDFNKLLILYS